MTAPSGRTRTEAELLVEAVNQNTRAILALARLLSERLSPRVERSVMTQEESEAAWRARMPSHMVDQDEEPSSPSDRDLLQAAVNKAAAMSTEERMLEAACQEERPGLPTQRPSPLTITPGA